MNLNNRYRILALGLVGPLLLGATTVGATILTNVPMQGGMVMPMIAYQAATTNLTVMVPGTVPALTPLLVSNPADTFDPADPWYNSLDPFRQGLSFSRRYGFVMDGMSDPIPTNLAIWIRKDSGTPGLEVYRYSGTAPKAWEPIFGTAGASNALFWNRMMFHPCFATLPGTNALTATFVAYLVDTANGGVEVPNSSTMPMVLNFTNLSDGRPELGLAMKFAIAWPAGTTNYVLEAADTLASTNWTVVTNVATTIDGQPTVLLGTDPGKYFRMRPAP